MKKIVFLLLLPLFVFSQSIDKSGGVVELYGAATDTIANITNQDTLAYRPWIDGEAGAWTDVTGGDGYITAAEKTGETNQYYILSDESNWGWMEILELGIFSGNAASAQLTGETVRIGHLRGAVSVIASPDTSGTNTTYTIKVGGN